MIPALLIPFAIGETWWGVFAGLIPIIGLALILWVLWRAAQPPEDADGSKDDEDA